MLALGLGEWSPDGAPPVRSLQRQLTRAGDDPGPIDGRYGPRTELAVARFQAGHGLQVDGIAGPITLAVLSRPTQVMYPGLGYSGHGSRRVRSLQRQLTRAGDAPGPIDGRYGPRTELAVSRFQAARGLQVDGIADAQTLAELTPRCQSGPRSPLGAVSDDRPRARSHTRPQSPPRQRAAAPRSSEGTPARHSTSFSLPELVALLIGLGLLGLAATWLIHYRRHRAVAASNGASRPGGAAGAQADPREGIEADQAFSLGVSLEERGELAGAIAAYERADRLGHGPAASNLGLLLEAQGDRAGAVAAYRRAEQRGDAYGAFNLGVSLEEEGELAGAIAAYQRADRLGHGPAASNLGLLLEAQGDRAGAVAAYRRAEQRGDAYGAFNLGVSLEEEGELAGAIAAYQSADRLGHGPAASNLGLLLEAQGDRAGAVAAYRRAEQRGDAYGAFKLAVSREERGELAGAIAAYQLGHSPVADEQRERAR